MSNSALPHPMPCSGTFARGTVVAYVGGELVAATDAVLAVNGGNWAGIVTTPSNAGVERATLQQAGFVPAFVTGLGAGATGPTYISGGVLTRTVTSYPCGQCDVWGNVLLSRNATSGSTSFFGPADTAYRRNSANTDYEWAFLANANVSATAAIAGTKVSPAFGAQDISTTGFWAAQYDSTAEGGAAPVAPVASTGDIRVPYQFTYILARNAANTADLVPLGDTAGFFTIGGYAFSMGTGESPDIRFQFPTRLKFTIGDVWHARSFATSAVALDIYPRPTGATLVNWRETVTNPSIVHTTTVSASGGTTFIIAQAAPFGTGGNVRLTGGTGATEAARGTIATGGQIAGQAALSSPLRVTYLAANFATDADHTVAGAALWTLALNATSSGSLTTTRKLILPLLVNAVYSVRNSTTGGQSIEAGGSTGSAVTIANGEVAWIVCTGSGYLHIRGLPGPTGATGATGGVGANGTGFVEDVHTASGSTSIPSTTTRVDIWLISGGGGGGGGAGGGGGDATPSGGGGGGGGAPGGAGNQLFVPLYPVTPSGSISATIPAVASGGTAGAGGTGGVDPVNGTAGTAGGTGATGGSAVAGVITLAGGTGGTGGTGGGPITYGPPAPGAGGAGGGGGAGAGGSGRLEDVGYPGGNVTALTNASVVLRTVYAVTSAGTFAGVLTGAGAVSGGATDSSGGGGGGAGANPVPRWFPQAGNSVSTGSGGAGGASLFGAETAGSAGGAGYVGSGGGGGGGGPSGSSVGDPTNGMAGGAGGAGGVARVVISFFTNTQEA